MPQSSRILLSSIKMRQAASDDFIMLHAWEFSILKQYFMQREEFKPLQPWLLRSSFHNQSLHFSWFVGFEETTANKKKSLTTTTTEVEKNTQTVQDRNGIQSCTPRYRNNACQSAIEAFTKNKRRTEVKDVRAKLFLHIFTADANSKAMSCIERTR